MKANQFATHVGCITNCTMYVQFSARYIPFLHQIELNRIINVLFRAYLSLT